MQALLARSQPQSVFINRFSSRREGQRKPHSRHYCLAWALQTAQSPLQERYEGPPRLQNQKRKVYPTASRPEGKTTTGVRLNKERIRNCSFGQLWANISHSKHSVSTEIPLNVRSGIAFVLRTLLGECSQVVCLTKQTTNSTDKAKSPSDSHETCWLRWFYNALSKQTEKLWAYFEVTKLGKRKCSEC